MLNIYFEEVMGKKCMHEILQITHFKDILQVWWEAIRKWNSNTVGLEKKNVVGLVLVLWARQKWELQVGGIPEQLGQESHNFCAIYIQSKQKYPDAE